LEWRPPQWTYRGKDRETRRAELYQALTVRWSAQPHPSARGRIEAQMRRKAATSSSTTPRPCPLTSDERLRPLPSRGAYLQHT